MLLCQKYGAVEWCSVVAKGEPRDFDVSELIPEVYKANGDWS